MRRWQAEAILSRYREPRDPVATLAVIVAVVMVLAPMAVGVLSCAGLVP